MAGRPPSAARMDAIVNRRELLSFFMFPMSIPHFKMGLEGKVRCKSCALDSGTLLVGAVIV